jgi:ferrous iron transport protein B
MMVVPLMTCSARLPVYTLIIAALFPTTLVWGLLPLQGLMMIGLYVFSLVLTLLVAGVLGRTVLTGRRVPLILELPPYRVPNLRLTAKLMVERAGVFLKEAGSIILVCTIALWALLSFAPPSSQPAPAPAAVAAVAPAAVAPAAAAETPAPPSAIERSYGGRLGKAIEPVLEPLGFDWRLGVGLIGAFAAREVFISTLGLVYGMEGLDDEALPLRERLGAKRVGEQAYTPLVGLSLLIFFAIACQCMSTLAVVKRETHGYRWPVFLFVYMTALAWVASFVVYQGGRALGLG